MKRTLKFIALLLVFTLAVSCFAMQGMVAFADTPVWDGTTVTKPAGAGTEADPYLVSNGEELLWMVKNSNHHYKLTDDIYLNDIDKINWQTGEAEDGYTIRDWRKAAGGAPKFSGTVNGDGHVIYGLYIKDTTAAGGRTTGYGLIPVGGALNIVGLGVDNAYIEAYTNYSCGVFVGLGQGSLSGTIDQCYSGADVTIKGYDVGTIVGGGDIAGTLTIKNTYSLASATGSHLAGMVGDTWTLEYTFENCYAVGTRLTGKCGSAMLNYMKNSYCTVNYDNNPYLLESNMKGDIFTGNKMALSDAYEATESYPVLRIFANAAPSGWNRLAEAFENGDGSTASPYEISTVGQLAHAVALGGGKHYKLVNDIHINDADKINWATGELLDENYTPVPWFSGTDTGSAKYNGFSANMQWSGTFDGNNCTVSGLWYPNDFAKVTAGLIPGVSSGTIKNLNLSKSYIVGGRFIGSIASTFAGTAENIFIDDTVKVVAKRNVTVDSYSCGGIFGYTNGVTLKNCGFIGTLVGTSHVYGLVGTSWGTKVHAENCFSVGRQPFTTSIGAKNYTTKAEADANYATFYGNLYKVTNVYTDTHTQDNKVTYKYDSDGVDTDGDENAKLEYDQAVSYAVFTFTELRDTQMKGLDALENMSGLSTDFWYATTGTPKSKTWGQSHGDADLSGMEAVSGDIISIRKTAIGAEVYPYSDYNRDGVTDICDLVAVWNYCPTRYSGDFVYTLAHWFVPSEYVIIYPAVDTEAKAAANSLKLLLADKGISLSVYADTEKTETAKEILVGNTNRGLAETITTDGKYTISCIGQKLQLSANQSAYLKTAVKTFAKLTVDGFAPVTFGYHEYEGGSVTLNTKLTNWLHSDKRQRTYTYVWGDEFYGDTLNKNKWVCSTGTSKMSGYKDVLLLDNTEAVKVDGGSLKMTAQTYTDPSNPDIKYAVPASIHTQGTMEYRYGYIEIRARVPYRTGVWPSFWMQSAAKLGGRQNYDYFTEIDMFEVFGHTSDLYCNVHKWYSKDSNMATTHGITHIAAAEDGGISSWLGDLFGQPMGEEKRTLTSPEDWHTYGFAWDANYMCMYVDQTLFRAYDITSAKSVFGSTNAGKDSDMSGFNDPLYIIFNNHVFTENYSFQPNLITGNESNLPATYEIDYVRLYQGTETNTQLWTK